MPNGKSDVKSLEVLYLSLIDSLYKEALDKGQVLMPDQAMEQLSIRLKQLFPPSENLSKSKQASPIRLKHLNLRRKAHRRAVDLFYDSIEPGKMGAPPYSKEYDEQLLKWKQEGLSQAEMARRLGEDTNTPDARKRSIDRIRKQIAAAEKKTPLFQETSKKKSNRKKPSR